MAKILIVDDSAFARNNLRITVEDGGHEVIGLAENGNQALNLFNALKPELVLLDYLMEGMSGIEVLRKMMRKEPRIKVIMVSGMGDRSIMHKALEAGAKVFVRKPFAHNKMLKTIREVMEM